MRAIHLSSKLRPSAHRSITQEMQRVDRELHLELAESPINPAFIHMSSSIPNGCDPLFYLKINGEALWKWRELKMDPTQLFHALQNGLVLFDANQKEHGYCGK